MGVAKCELIALIVLTAQEASRAGIKLRLDSKVETEAGGYWRI